MRKQKALIGVLRRLVDLVADEAKKNPEFAERLEEILEPVPTSKSQSRKRSKPNGDVELPDVHSEWRFRDSVDFRLWLREQSVDVLRALIKHHDLDATRRTARWKDAEKLSGFIADQLQARLSRGASFLKDSR
jgi:hypothetical protein|tara:strand:+ start:3734 stop:4132 length:399 start_codon:yes stop_codon:yes gene_type:complete